LLPDVAIVGSEVSGLGLFARSPLTPEIVAELPPILLDGFVIARDERGGMLAIGAYTPRRPVAEAAAELAPDVTLDPVAPYMMLSGGLGPGVTPPPLSEWDDDTPAEMLAGMRATVADWHPALRGLVERVELPTLFSFPFRQLRPADPWPSSRVTLLGDAAHAMLPTLGQGGNMALRDAGVLCDALTAAARGERPVVQAMAAYETEMRDRVYPLMDASSDHDSFGGGGLRNRPAAPAGA
jgi:2-polyprenyl-6-methoxyphenol hydroxylase-like FAD-dependent oxidoreductase